MNALCFVDKVPTKRRKYSYSFNSQNCSSLTEQRIGHRTYEFRLISLLTTGQYHKDNHSVLQEASAVILFDSDSDNSIVYEDISLLFYNIQIKICAEYRDMLPRPRLVCQEPGLRQIGRSPGVPDKSSRGLGSMSHYSAQILLCFIVIAIGDYYRFAFFGLVTKLWLKFQGLFY